MPSPHCSKQTLNFSPIGGLGSEPGDEARYSADGCHAGADDEPQPGAADETQIDVGDPSGD